MNSVDGKSVRTHLDDVGDACVEALLTEEALDVLVSSGHKVVLVEELLQLAPEHPTNAIVGTHFSPVSLETV